PSVDVLDDRILCVWIEVRRLDDDAPDVGLPVAAFGGEHFGRAPAGGSERGDVAVLDLHHGFLIGGAPEYERRRGVEAGPDVEVKCAVRRPGRAVVAVLGSVRYEVRAVEVDAIVVQEIRILASVHAASGEINLTLGLVDVLDVAHDPVALGDLTLHAAGGAVVEIEMVPAVALRHPDHFAAVGDVVAELLPGVADVVARRPVVEEGLRVLRDDDARRAGRAVDLDHAVLLVAALIVLEGEGMAILAPGEPRYRIRIGE